MYIYNIGIDIIERLRVEKLIEKNPDVIRRLCTDDEQKQLAGCTVFERYITACARFFVLKESVMKACGIGWQEGVSWQDISVQNTLQCQTPVLHGQLSVQVGKHAIKKIIANVCGDSSLVAAHAYALSW
ncbi:4'-phosphopantetheinyl transferase superfamily protein [bacterium]|nr:4'-phosphopantetheinyl transferase superfamily protein [bacterium]